MVSSGKAIHHGQNALQAMGSKSDQENLVLDRKVTRSQRWIVLVVLDAGKRCSRNNFRKKNRWLFDVDRSRAIDLVMCNKSFESRALVINNFIFAAGRLRSLVAGGKRLFFLAAFSLAKQGNVLNLAHTKMHADGEAGGRNQYQNGEKYG
jgi:hypothetical protein